MNTFLTALILLYPATIFFLPLFLYGKTGRRMMWFYRRMAGDARCSKSYVLALAVIVLLYNFIFFQVQGPNLWQVPGFLASMILLNTRFTSATMRWLHDDRVMLMMYFSLFLFVMMMPELFTLGVTLATVLLASLFYPSKRVMKTMAGRNDCPAFHGTNHEIYELYF